MTTFLTGVVPENSSLNHCLLPNRYLHLIVYTKVYVECEGLIPS